MKLVLGTPVANREWILGAWFACLAQQTQQLDELIFVHSGERHDATRTELERGAKLLGIPAKIIFDAAPPHQRHDNKRFGTLARLRDRALSLAFNRGATHYLSLDTDILLEDEQTLAKLVAQIDLGWDVVAPVTWLQPTAVDPKIGGWAVNAFRFNDRDDSKYRGMHRLERVDGMHAQPVDFCAAVQMFGTRVLRSCRYVPFPHVQGEDVGMGRALQTTLDNPLVLWDPTVQAQHVWDQSALLAA